MTILDSLQFLRIFYGMTLKQAVKKLGGPFRAASISGVPRTNIIYWMKVAVPKWRQSDADKIIALAQQPAEAPQP